MMQLRVHHLLCSALYVGKGYSEEFCENMKEIVQRLWNCAAQGQEQDGKLQEEIMLVIEPDSICQKCPNLTKEGCSLDDNHVVSKDAALAQKLGLEINKHYEILQLMEHTAKNLSKEIFETSCHNCEWYKMGLCRYEKLVEKYKAFG